ncbi:helix-turn-helix domain-containing protein [Fusobacterium russii]|uniref:helix-turn-helix domain-containing protein n=1 Tax=Fusobacterium russii TaxID=854 RepID=UPI00039FFAF4|nr:helix-turn-helix domain-containing protein [Fusobacterium russii]
MNIRAIILEILKNRIGEYASAKKLQENLGLSLTFIYMLVKNENVKSRAKYGRKEYELSSFLNSLNFSTNIYPISNPLTQEDFYINNFFNWSPKNEIETFLENMLLDNLGEFCSTKDLVQMFGISKTSWYDLMERGEIMCLNIESRKIIVTRSLLPFLRESMQDF